MREKLLINQACKGFLAFVKAFGSFVKAFGPFVKSLNSPLAPVVTGFYPYFIHSVKSLID